jgi:hypothetical protein
MIELVLILSTVAITLSLIAIHRYNSYHKGLNELIQRMDQASLFHTKVDQSILSIEHQGQTLAKNLEAGLQVINTVKTDVETIQRTTNGLVAKVR